MSISEKDVLHPEVKITLDLKQLLRDTLEGMRNDIDFAYPHKIFDEERAHTALMECDARAKTLLNLLNALK